MKILWLTLMHLSLVAFANPTDQKTTDLLIEEEQVPGTDVPTEHLNTSPTPIPSQDEKGTLTTPEDLQQRDSQQPEKSKKKIKKTNKKVINESQS